MQNTLYLQPNLVDDHKLTNLLSVRNLYKEHIGKEHKRERFPAFDIIIGRNKYD